MTVRHIPSRETRRWSGIYPGSFYGTIWKTFNVDLDRNEGKVCLSPRFEIIEDSSDSALGLSSNYARAFIRTDADCTDRYWALRENGLTKSDSVVSIDPSVDWDTDGLSNSPTLPLDFTIHGNDSRNDSGRNKLFVTTDTGDIYVLNDTGNNVWTTSWWVTKQSQPSLNQDVPFHPIEYFPFRKISLVGDGNLIHTISRLSDTQNDTVTYARLTLPKEYVLRHFIPTGNRIWGLCYNKFGGFGAIVEWDGFTQSYNEIHSAHSISPLTGVNYEETPIILNSEGVVLEFNGRGFVPMVRNGQVVALPISVEQDNNFITLDGDSSQQITSPISPRSACVGEDHLIYFNIGVPRGTDTNQGTSYQDAGIWCLNPITGRIYNKYSLPYVNNSDFGQQRMLESGAIYRISLPTTTNSKGRDFLASGRVYNDASNTRGGIWLLNSLTDTDEAQGYVVTEFIHADQILEMWDTLWLSFKRFQQSGSQIIVKARGTFSMQNASGNRLQKVITWTGSSTFTVTMVSSEDPLRAGDEVEILGGVNAGYVMHIDEISGAHGALQTITVDESMPVSSGTSLATFDRWKKLGTITSNTKFHDKLNVGIDSSFIQFKVLLRGSPRDLELAELISISKPSLNLE